MLNPEEIRRLVLQGQTPENGRVIRGSALLAARDALIRAASIPLIGITVSMVSALNLMRHFHPSSVDFIIARSFIYTDLVLLLLVLVINPLIRAIIAQKSFIAFLPDICVQFTNIHSSSPHKCQVLRYASIADIQLHNRFWTGIYLVVRNHQGQKQKWYPDPCYGSRARTLQDILTAYTTYNALNVSRVALPSLPVPLQ